MASLDADSVVFARQRLAALSEDAIQGMATGDFYDASGNISAGKVERQRGIIIGIGLCMDALDKIINPPETHSEDAANELYDR